MVIATTACINHNPIFSIRQLQFKILNEALMFISAYEGLQCYDSMVPINIRGQTNS